MRKKEWKDFEIEFLKLNLHLRLATLTWLLNTSRSAIKRKMKELDLKHKSIWTQYEIQVLKENPDLSLKKLSRLLNRSISSIKQKRHELGLKKRKPWTDDEIQLLKELLQNHSFKEIARKLNRSIVAVQHKAHALGLKPNSEVIKRTISIGVCASFKRNPWSEKISTALREFFSSPKSLPERIRRSERVKLLHKNPDWENHRIQSLKTKEFREKCRLRGKSRDCSHLHTPEAWKKNFESRKLKPNKAEQKLLQCIRELNLPYEYVGNGAVWIGGLNPDFISWKEKKIIELFGRYWHSGENLRKQKTENERRRIFKQAGFEMLVIWDKPDLKDLDFVKSRLLEFTYGKGI